MTPPAPALVPELHCRDLSVSLAFYRALGFVLLYERGGFACVGREGARIMLEEIGEAAWLAAPAEVPFGRGMHLQIAVGDVAPVLDACDLDAVFRRLETVWYRSGDRWIGQRQFVAKDPDGYLLRFMQPLGEADAPGEGRVVG